MTYEDIFTPSFDPPCTCGHARDQHFDRWLAAHDAGVKAEALREFAASLPDAYDTVAAIALVRADRIERDA